MNLCKDCIFFGEEVVAERWDDTLEDWVEKPTGFHPCKRIQFNESTGQYLDEDNSKACVIDGSGYFAAIRVKEDFGCVEWRGKGGLEN